MDGGFATLEARPVGRRFAAGEERCLPSPDRAREKQYADAAIGVVLSGWVDYRAQGGMATAVPGTAIFGNPGEWFSCLRLGEGGNRRLVAYFDPGFVEEVAGDCGLDRAAFPSAALAPSGATARVFGWLRRMALQGPGCEEAAYELAGLALNPDPAPGSASEASPQERRRIEAVVRHIETAYAEPCPLGALAELAGLSRYHFLRRFREIAGQSPNQYVIHTRLRAAAEALLSTRAPIAEIALDVGFNDISHFNACFRAVFGCAPRAWRAGKGK